MDPYLITILAALIGALSAQAVGYLTHYSSEQRERLSRQYTFKEKQLQNLYAPILAHLVDLVARWELVQHLREDREKLIKSHKLKDFESTEQLRKPVAQYHSDQYAYQLQVLEKVATLAKENIQYAEPDTKKHIKNLFRFFFYFEVVVKYHIPVDATGEEIPSPIDPFPNWFKEFIKIKCFLYWFW